MKLPKVASARSPRSVFQAVIAYEDFDAGRRAMDVCKLLVAQLGNEVQFRCSMWKFEVLRCPKLQRIAVGDARDADMILVATGSSGELPAEVKRWVESWVPERQGQAAALLALLQGTAMEGTDPVAAENYLRAAAIEAGIDFLPQTDRTGPLYATPFDFNLPADRFVSGPAPEGWGLND